jgi:predicted DNA-binding protein (UPF0251 family)
VFRPDGISTRSLEEVVLTLDEFEALRLADLNGLYHEQAAVSMNVSRQTFGRIIDGARRKTAEALILGRTLRIKGGQVEKNAARHFKCHECRHTWEQPSGNERPQGCPKCKSTACCRDNSGNRQDAGGPDQGKTSGRKQCCPRGSQAKQNSTTPIEKEK